MKKLSSFLILLFLIVFANEMRAQVTLPQPDSLIKGELSTIYYYAADGYRYVFPNSKTFGSWFSDYGTVTTVPNEVLGQIPLKGNVTYRPGVRMVKITTVPKVYVVDQGGQLRWVKSEELAKKLYGEDWNKKIDDVPDEFFANYQEGAPIESETEYSPSVAVETTQTINHDRGIKETVNAIRATTNVGSLTEIRELIKEIKNLKKSLPSKVPPTVVPPIFLPFSSSSSPTSTTRAVPAIPAIPAIPTSSTATSTGATPAVPAIPAVPIVPGQPIIIPPAPTATSTPSSVILKVLYPNGSETLYKGNSYNILWQNPLASGFAGDKNMGWAINLYRLGGGAVLPSGATIVDFGSIVPVKQSSYQWTVTSTYISAADYAIRIALVKSCLYQDAPCPEPTSILPNQGKSWYVGDESDAVFSITSPPVDTIAPTVPTNLTATALSSSQIKISWYSSTDNIKVTGYKIYRNGTLLTSVTSTATYTTENYTDSGLTAGTTYTYTVAAYDAAGNVSGQTTSVSGTTLSDSSAIDISAPSVPSLAVTADNFILKWGSNGTGDGQFQYPSGVAVDMNGNVFVMDSNNHRIQKFTSNGVFITKWGSNGFGDGQIGGQISGARGIAIDTGGNVYAADQFNNRIQKFTNNGVFITKWGTFGTGDGQFNQPYALAVDASNNVYVVDGNSRVQKFTSNGAFITKWGNYGTGNGEFDRPTGIRIDKNGNIYIADSFNKRIQKFTSNGAFITKWGDANQFVYPRAIAVDTNNNVYVTDINTTNLYVYNYTNSGVFITKWGAKGVGNGQFNGAEGMATDLNNNLYITDIYNHRVQKFGISSVSADTTPPTVSITSPAADATVSGSNINVTVASSDNVGVKKITLNVDGAFAASAETSNASLGATTNLIWNASNASNGSHTLVAVARDAAGNSATSTAVTVNVSNTAPPAAPLAGANSGALFGAGWPIAKYTQHVRFNYDSTKLSEVQSFRFYEKKPTDSNFNLVDTFSNPAPLATNCSGYVYGTAWNLSYLCSANFWSIGTRGAMLDYIAFPVGEYDFYVTAVNSDGQESAPSPTFKEYVLEPTEITSPTTANQPTSQTPTFRWTVAPSGWAYNPSFYIQVYEDKVLSSYASPIYTKGVTVTIGNTAGSKLYDGPALDPAKKYIVQIDVPGQMVRTTANGDSTYISMAKNLESFTVPATTSSTAYVGAPSVMVAGQIENSLYQFKETLRRGSKGEAVKQLQKILVRFAGVYPEGLVTGYFGALTEAAVKRFQTQNNLEAVGVVGPKTRMKLNALADY